MALTSDFGDCFQPTESKYRCKHFKTIRKKYLKDYSQHFVGYRHVKEEIIFLEQTSTLHQEQEHQETGFHGFVKYSKKRCNCKTKKVTGEKIDDDDENNNNSKPNKASSCQFREISFLTSTSSSSTEKCTSILASAWHWKAFPSPLGDIRATANSFILDPLTETLVPNKLESSMTPSISSSSSLSSSTKCTHKFPYSNFHHQSFNLRSRRTPPQSTTTTKLKSSMTSISTSCDNLYDYSNINSNTSSLNKLTKATFGKKQSVATVTSSLKKHPKFRCNYMLMILIMIVKEFIRHFCDTLNRMKRKTQFLLPILILLQLLMAAPFTHCTSPPNTNQSIAATMSASNSSSADLLSSPTSTSSAITSAALVNNLSIQNKKIADQEKYGQSQRSSLPSASSQLSPATRISEIPHRPTGGSSITSYFGHEAKIRRDPSLSYTNSGCHSCQMREQVKADNLESIKRHILLRLEMQTLPNITAPQVPRTIIENFYKSHSFNGNKKSSTSASIHSQQESTQSYSEGATETKNGLGYKTYPLSQTGTFINSNSNNGKVNGGSKRNDNNMQGDDPNIFPSDFDKSVDHDVEEDDDEEGDKDDDMLRNNLEDEFFSVINSVYVFPTMPRVRHNRKAEILNFKFKGSEHSTISQALLHVYIRGRDWMRENEPDQSDKKNINEDHNDIIITIHRVIRRINSTIATHTVNINESKHKIPNGPGQWISIDVTQLVQGWVRNSTTNQGIVIKASETWMRPFIITGDLPNNKAFTVYIEMLTKDNRKRRTKRNTSMNCSESDNEERCCRYPLVVNFIEFDWTWVVAPTQFNAYFCNGECKLGFLEKYPHTHLMQLSTAPQPCCSPTKMSPLRLLYFNTENTLVMSTIPNMAVEKCSCS